MATRTQRWRKIATEAAECTSCELYEHATQTVFGAGPVDAPIMMVGEQPGDVEDNNGHPFVGPAGRVLWEAVDDSGLSHDDLYVTNAVKHFRFELRGKRRIHKTPGAEHVRACHQWIEAELDIVEPKLLVLLGATAASALAPQFRVMRDRGEITRVDGQAIMVTVHPSAVLRADNRAAAMDEFVNDLKVAAQWLARQRAAS